MVSQIVEKVATTVQNAGAGPEETANKEAQPQFSIDDWGMELKKEIMEETKAPEKVSPPVETPPRVSTGIDKTEEVSVQKQEPVEQPMQVVSIAEGIVSEPVGTPASAVEIPEEPVTPAQVEPTSLVEPKIDLTGPINEETAKYIKEVVERIVWEVVPELAEKLIKAELKRLMSEKEE